jgi:hypothetical protein
MNVRVHYRRPGQVAGRQREAGFTVESTVVFGLDQTRPGAIILAAAGSASVA